MVHTKDQRGAQPVHKMIKLNHQSLLKGRGNKQHFSVLCRFFLETIARVFIAIVDDLEGLLKNLTVRQCQNFMRKYGLKVILKKKS